MTAVQTADQTPTINPLAAINREAHDAEYGDAINRSLSELTARVATLRGDLDTAVREAGDDFDVTKVRALRGDTPRGTMGNLVDHHSRLIASQEQLNQRRAILASAQRRARGEGRHEDDNEDFLDMLAEGGTGRRPAQQLDFTGSLRAAMTERGIGSYVEAMRHRASFDMDVGFRPLAATLTRGTGYEDNFPTQTAGFPAWSDRSGIVGALGRAPLSYLDVVPIGAIGQAAHIYERETEPTSSTSTGSGQSTDAATAASGAAARNEAANLAESTFLWERIADPVQSIGHFVPVTLEQLEDAPRFESLLEMRMRFGVRQRVNIQIASGSGTAPNIKGFTAFDTAVTTTSAATRLAGEKARFIETNAADVSATDTTAKRGKAILLAAKDLETQLMVQGAVTPSAFMMHPVTWHAVCITESASGGFYFGDPRLGTANALWGYPVVMDQYGLSPIGANTMGTAGERFIFAGDFAMQSEFLLRHDVRVEFGMNDTDFRKLQQSVRAYVRGCLSIYRIKAFGYGIGF